MCFQSNVQLSNFHLEHSMKPSAHFLELASALWLVDESLFELDSNQENFHSSSIPIDFMRNSALLSLVSDFLLLNLPFRASGVRTIPGHDSNKQLRTTKWMMWRRRKIISIQKSKFTRSTVQIEFIDRPVIFTVCVVSLSFFFARSR